MTHLNTETYEYLDGAKERLLKRPEKIGIGYRTALIGSYHHAISTLKDHFNFRAEKRPALPINVYYYSDNHLPHDTAIKEIDYYLDTSINAVSLISGIAKPDVKQGYVLSQDWISSGFDLAQTTRQGVSGVGKVTFLNCAPRLDERGQEGNDTNKGEPIYVGILPNGHVISANSRYNFVFFRDMIANGSLEVFEASVQADGTQFRSRDIFPTHVAVLTNLLTQNLPLWKHEMSIDDRRNFLKQVGYVDLQKRLLADQVPELEKFTVANVESHGNVKTNTRLSELSVKQREYLESGSPFTVRLGDCSIQAIYTPSMFARGDDHPEGLSQGSSGVHWQGSCDAFQRAVHANDPAHGLPVPDVDGFLEFTVIGGDAGRALGIKLADIREGLVLHIPELEVANDVTPEVPGADENDDVTFC